MAKLFLTPIDLNGNEIRNVRIHILASDPGSPTSGQLWYNSTDNILRYYNGTSVQDLTEAGLDTEAAQDLVGAMFTGNTETGVTVTYQDVDGTIDVEVDPEFIRDTIASFVVAGNNIDVTHVDGSDTLTIDVESLTSADITDFNEAAQDTIGGILVDSSRIDFTYNDGTPSITADIVTDSVGNTYLSNMPANTVKANITGGSADPTDVTLASFKTWLALVSTDITDFAEAVSDQVGTMVTGNTETGITVTYQDADNTLDFAVGTLDTLPAPVASLSLNSQKITNLADGTAASDAVTLGQLNSVSAGLDWKASVRVATTGNITIATALNSGDSIDGVTLANGDRVLVKDQSTGAQNGIYVVAASPGRATDADASAEVTGGMAVWVNEGTTNADTGWVLTTNDAITLDTTALVFTQFSGLGQITAGNALTKTGNTLDVAPGTGLEISSDTIRIAAAAAGAGLTGGAGSALAVGAGTGITVNADDVALAATVAGAGLTHTTGVLAVGAGNGITVNADDVALASSTAGAGLTYTTGVLAVGAGTGITVNADDIQINTSLVARKAVGALTGGATSEVLTHNLGSRDVVVSVLNNATPWEEVEVDVEATSTNTVTIRAANNLPASYRWIVVG